MHPEPPTAPASPPPFPSRKPFPGILQSLGLLGVALMLGLGAMLLVFLIQYLRTGEADLQPTGWIISVVNSVAFFGAGALGWFLTRRRFLSVFPFRPFPMALVPPMVLLAPAALVVINLITYVGMEMSRGLGSESWMQDLIRELLEIILANRVAAFFMVVIMAPVTEEVFFRGLVLQGFLQRYTVRKALVASTVLFAVAHFSPAQLVATLALGFYLGWLCWRTGSLWPAIIGHALNNLAALSTSWYLEPSEVESFGPGPWWLNLSAALACIGLLLWIYAVLNRWPAPPHPRVAADTPSIPPSSHSFS